MVEINIMRSAMVITVSDRASKGIYEDLSGPLLAQGLVEQGYNVTQTFLIPDEFDEITNVLTQAISNQVRLVVTTGGTGVSPRDITPEATMPFIEKLIPGFSESIRAQGREKNDKSDLSRAVAGINGKTLIINLPGSQGGVRDGLKVISRLAGHILEQLDGADHVN